MPSWFIAPMSVAIALVAVFARDWLTALLLFLILVILIARRGG